MNLWYLLQSSFDGAPYAPDWFCEMLQTWRDREDFRRRHRGGRPAVATICYDCAPFRHSFLYLLRDGPFLFVRGFTHPCSSDRSWLFRLFVCASKPRYPTQRNTAGRIGNKVVASNEQASLSDLQRTCPIAFLHFAPSHGATPPDYNDEQS